MKALINNNNYNLSKAPIIGLNTLELYFEDPISEIDFKNGIILYSSDPFEDGMDYTSYNKKWNVLTELENGIVLTNTNIVETEDTRLIIYPELEPEPEIPDLEERIRDLEAAICELAEGI